MSASRSSDASPSGREPLYPTATTIESVSGSPAEEDLTFDGRPAGHEGRTGYWFGLMAIMVVLSEQVALSYNLISVAIPHIVTHFHTAQVAWVITIFSLVGAISTPVFGKLGDIFGKRRMILVGVLSTTMGSVVCLAAPSFGVLLIGRALQGLALPLSALVYSLMRDIFPRRHLTLAVSITFSGVGVVTIAGPFLAGWLTDAFGYRGPFWFLLLLPLISGLLIMAFVPETPLRNRTRVDWPGALLLGLGVLGILLGVGQGPAWGWSSSSVLGLIGGGIALLVIWGFYEHANRDNGPLVNLRLLGSRPVATTMIVGMLTTTAIAGAATLIPIMVQTPHQAGYGFGASALGSASFTVLAGVTTTAFGMLLGVMAKRLGMRTPLIAGCLVLALGVASLAFWHTERWQVIVFWAIAGIGGGITYGAIPNLVVAAVPAEQQGVGSGMVGLLQNVGAATGLQALFAVMLLNVSVYVQGSPLYSNDSFVWGFLMCAGCAVVAGLVSTLIPHGGRPAPGDVLERAETA